MAIREQLEMRSPIAVLFAVVIGSVAAFSASAQEIVPDVITSENAAMLGSAVDEVGGWTIDFSPKSNHYSIASYGARTDVSTVLTRKNTTEMDPDPDEVWIVDPGNTEYLVVRYSPDGNLLAIGSELGEVLLYDTHRMTIVDVLDGHSRAILDLAFDPTSRFLVSTSTSWIDADPKSAIFWDLNDGSSTPLPISGNVYAVAFHPLDHYVAISTYGEVLFFQFEGTRTTLVRILDPCTLSLLCKRDEVR
jgi:WD40 repeat protein